MTLQTIFLDKWCLSKRKHSCLEMCHEVFQPQPISLCLLTRAANNVRNVCMSVWSVAICLRLWHKQIHCYMPIPQLFDLGLQEKRFSYAWGNPKCSDRTQHCDKPCPPASLVPPLLYEGIWSIYTKFIGPWKHEKSLCLWESKVMRDVGKLTKTIRTKQGTDFAF